jgi:outer membrane protein assembly factor BamB
MQANTTLADPKEPTQQVAPDRATPSRLWLAVGLITVFWVLFVVVARLEKPYFIGFLYSMAAPAVLSLLFFVWWWTNRRIRFGQRLYGFVLVVGTGVLVAPFCHKSIWFNLPTLGLPVVLTGWTLWMLFVKKTAFSWNRLGLLVLVALTWGCFTLVRIDGADADLRADIRWRWNPSAEDLFLAEKARTRDKEPAGQASGLQPILSLTPGDWPAFRGPDRDGVIHGVKIATDWNTAPPKLLWRQRVGPAWSSVIVMGDRLFTQEQRGEQETVVCYEAMTGKELWIHEDPCRFWEAVSGAGPRATPTFADGRLYTLGATGILNCLDAVTGNRHWSHDITVEAAAKAPLWGFSGSPLVVEGLVIVFAGGEENKHLLAYHTQSGELAWTAPASPGSYSSPQLTTIGGKRQCLLLGDHGLTAVDPATGAVLWQHGPATPGAPRVVQPHLLGQTQLVGTFAITGLALIDVTREGEEWKVAPVWATTQMKPEFPDFVVYEGHVYGFDGSVFCCIDLATGKRSWKEGRYGRGQVMLLADPSLLLVLTETGEAILLATNPQRHEERGRFRALEGKTWSHPVIAHGRLYVRNAEEMACYELGGY